MGWLDAAFQTAVPMLTGHLQGQVQGTLLQDQRRKEEEDRQARLQQQALQQQLLQAQLESSRATAERAAHPPTPWASQGFGSQEEQLTYEEALAKRQHPERYERPDPGTQTPWAKAGFTDQASYLEYLRKQSQAENPQRFEKPDASSSGFDVNDPQNHQKFLTAYLQRTGQGHTNPLTLEYEAAPPPEQRIKDAEAAYQEMVKLTSPDYNPADDQPAGEAEGWHAPMAPGVVPEDLPGAGPVRQAAPPAAPAPAAAPVPEPGRMPSGPVSSRPPTRQPGMSLGARIAQLKAQGVSKEDGFRILQGEGYVDANGNAIDDEEQ